MPATRVIHVIAEKTAQGASMKSIIEETETAQAEATSEQPKAAKKAKAGKRVRNVGPKKGNAGKKATPVKKAPKSAKSDRRPRGQ
jgi:hypothetical protein